MLKNRTVRAIAGGFATALAVAGPLVDNGVTPSEVCAIVLAFLGGAGLTATPNKSAE